MFLFFWLFVVLLVVLGCRYFGNEIFFLLCFVSIGFDVGLNIFLFMAFLFISFGLLYFFILWIVLWVFMWIELNLLFCINFINCFFINFNIVRNVIMIFNWFFLYVNKLMKGMNWLLFKCFNICVICLWVDSFFWFIWWFLNILAWCRMFCNVNKIFFRFILGCVCLWLYFGGLVVIIWMLCFIFGSIFRFLVVFL